MAALGASIVGAEPGGTAAGGVAASTDDLVAGFTPPPAPHISGSGAAGAKAAEMMANGMAKVAGVLSKPDSKVRSGPVTEGLPPAAKAKAGSRLLHSLGHWGSKKGKVQAEAVPGASEPSVLTDSGPSRLQSSVMGAPRPGSVDVLSFSVASPESAAALGIPAMAAATRWGRGWPFFVPVLHQCVLTVCTCLDSPE